MPNELLKEGDGTNKSLKKSFKIYFFIILGLIVAIAVLFLLLLLGGKSKAAPTPLCGDGSLYRTCSIDKPYYCNNGTLITNVSSCGCPSGIKENGTKCVYQYQTGGKNSSFYYILDGKSGTINLTLYYGLVNYFSTVSESINYAPGQVPQRSDFTFVRINNQDQYYLLEPLVKEIQNMAPESKTDQARIAISLVQNIPWGSSGKTIQVSPETSVGYSRYPYQVLYDDQGLCGEKSELLAFILRDIGYGVALFYYPNQDHEALGIKCPLDESLNDTGYCFVETSGPSIITDNNLVYAGGIRLNSTPQLIVLANGISLPENLPEYNDAKKLESLQHRFFLGPIASYELNKLKNKYGLAESYNLT